MLKKNANFTLIELLVVIAIISILASILLPALKRARDMSKRISCTENQKQIGIAFTMYRDDFDSYFPSFLNSASTGKQYWTTRFRNLDYVSGKTFYCPSFEGIYDGDKSLDSAAGSDPAYTHYGYNHMKLGPASETTGSPASVKASKVLKPTKTLLTTDSTFNKNFNIGSCRAHNYLSGGPNHFPHARHLNGVVILWCDNHVDWMKIRNILNPYQDITNSSYTYDYWGLDK